MRAVDTYKRLALLGAVAVAVAGAAGAQVIRCERFSYPDGALVPNGGWANHSGTAATLLVASGEAIVEHGTPSEDANLSFAPISGNIYYALDFTVEDPGGPIPGTDNEYFAHFREGFNFSARLDVVPATSGGDFSVGIASDESTADAIWASDLSYGTTYRAVVRYDQDLNIAELWVNPTVSTDTSILGEDRSDPGDSVVSVALRQSDSDMNETVRVDNVMVGYTFDDVVTTTAVCGTQAQRFGAVPNAGILAAGDSPDIGSTWNPTITATGILDVLGLSFTAGIDVPTALGTLLCNLPVSSAFIFASASGAPFAIGIPSDPSLVGVAICSQGAGIAGSGAIELTNALDITLGG